MDTVAPFLPHKAYHGLAMCASERDETKEN